MGGVKSGAQQRQFASEFAGVPFSHNDLVVAAAKWLDRAVRRACMSSLWSDGCVAVWAEAASAVCWQGGGWKSCIPTDFSIISGQAVHSERWLRCMTTPCAFLALAFVVSLPRVCVTNHAAPWALLLLVFLRGHHEPAPLEQLMNCTNLHSAFVHTVLKHCTNG